MDVDDLLLAGLAFVLGGILKGATGAGAPILAVPVLALMQGVPFAIAVFTLPNLVSNSWQTWQYRRYLRSPRFAVNLAAGGAMGALAGTVVLVKIPSHLLMAVVGCVVLAYIAFRLARPGWSLTRPVAERLALPVATIGGVLQGASGISAPVSITFLNAMRLDRAEFIANISVFFVVMSVVQIPALYAFGVLTAERVVFSLVALAPLVAGMLFGAWLGHRISKAAFDRLILGLLAVIALRLLFVAFT